jgi:hypothetical protein
MPTAGPGCCASWTKVSRARAERRHRRGRGAPHTKWGPAFPPAPTAPSFEPRFRPCGHLRSPAQASPRRPSRPLRIIRAAQRPFLGWLVALSRASLRTLHPARRSAIASGAFVEGRTSWPGAVPSVSRRRSCVSISPRFRPGGLLRFATVVSITSRRCHDIRVVPSGICPQPPVDNGDIGDCYGFVAGSLMAPQPAMSESALYGRKALNPAGRTARR